MVGVASPSPQETADSPGGDAILAGPSWGDQLDAAAPLADLIGDVCVCDSGDECISLGSDDDGDDSAELFVLPPAAKPATGDASSGPPNPTACMDLQEACKRAAAKLGIA